MEEMLKLRNVRHAEISQKVTEMNALLIKIQYTNTESRYKE